MKVRVAEAKNGVRLPDSKVTVMRDTQTIVENKKVGSEILVPISQAGDYKITVDTGGKYFDMGTRVHIDCSLYQTCQNCQESLDILIPLFEHKDIGTGNMSLTFSWSGAPHKMDFVVRGRLLDPVDASHPNGYVPHSVPRFLSHISVMP